MADRPKLVYAVAVPLVLYSVMTALWVDWRNLEGTQLFALIKHVSIVLILAASLFFYLRIGCLATLAWCTLVPLERYGALFRELTAIQSGEPVSLAVIDIVRIFLLLVACVLSAALVFVVHVRPANRGSASADA